MFFALKKTLALAANEGNTNGVRFCLFFKVDIRRQQNYYTHPEKTNFLDDAICTVLKKVAFSYLNMDT